MVGQYAISWDYAWMIPSTASISLQSNARIFAGFSSGANVAAAMHLLQGSLRGAVVGVIACDSGLKYLTTDLWS